MTPHLPYYGDIFAVDAATLRSIAFIVSPIPVYAVAIYACAAQLLFFIRAICDMPHLFSSFPTTP